jgi:hypothetical protein
VCSFSDVESLEISHFGWLRDRIVASRNAISITVRTRPGSFPRNANRRDSSRADTDGMRRLMSRSSQQPATSNQQPATSNQQLVASKQPAASNQ